MVELAYERKLARKPAPYEKGLAQHVREHIYEPIYPDYV